MTFSFISKNLYDRFDLSVATSFFECVFISYSTPDAGGAIFVNVTEVELEALSCVVSNCSSGSVGGAICVFACEVATLMNSYFIDNKGARSSTFILLASNYALGKGWINGTSDVSKVSVHGSSYGGRKGASFSLNNCSDFDCSSFVQAHGVWLALGCDSGVHAVHSQLLSRVKTFGLTQESAHDLVMRRSNFVNNSFDFLIIRKGSGSSKAFTFADCIFRPNRMGNTAPAPISWVFFERSIGDMQLDGTALSIVPNPSLVTLPTAAACTLWRRRPQARAQSVLILLTASPFFAPLQRFLLRSL
jgi:hypothetical protein